MKRYFTGVPCKQHGHIAEWYVKDERCVKCQRLRGILERAQPEHPARNTKRVKQFQRGIPEHELPPPLVADHCDLCGKPARLVWDHDHVLADLGFPKVEQHRGWLCFHCNTGLGKLGDTVQSLKRALAYLQRC
jgi:hypothetical protein